MSDEEKASPRTVILPSCLRNGSNSSSITSNTNLSKCRVSFPDDDRDLVTEYLEPASPWDSVPVSPEDLVGLYKESCEKHGVEPLEQVLDQLQGCFQTCPSLEISGPLDLPSLEALEAVFRRVRFQTIRIRSVELSDDAAVALFEMLEYYESTATLSVTCSNGLGLRGWQACSRMIKKAHCLEELDVRGTPLNEQVMPVLCRSLKVGSNLTALQLGRCELSGRSLAVLTAALRLNTTLQELTLADNELVPSDALLLSSMLKVNNTLRFLDVSNNYIQDIGCGHLCEGLAEQKGEGLQALVLWNTQLTSRAAEHVASMMAVSCLLETLNVGQNHIGNRGLAALRCSLAENKVLKQLGMQAAHVNCEGAIVLAEVLLENSVLRRIDSRSNHIGVEGLTALKNALDTGASVQRIDLDDCHGECQTLVEEIREFCRLNEARALVEEELENSRSSFSRKISLTCETLMFRNAVETNNNLLSEPKQSRRLRSPEPSPVPSPASSPVPSPSRHRFRVSRVSESESSDCSSTPASPVSSRFRVTLVEPAIVYAEPSAPRVRFDCSPQPLSNEEPPDPGRKRSLGSDSVFEDNHSPPAMVVSAPPTESSPAMVKPVPQQAEQDKEVRRRKVSVTPVTKPPTSLEKLLGLFQNPGSLFSSVSLGEKARGEARGASEHADKSGESASEDSAWDWGLPISLKDNKNTEPLAVSAGLLSESQSKNNNNM